MVSSATAVGNVCTGLNAGSVFGLPVVRSKREPWRVRPVVVRAAVLDRVDRALAVEDADLHAVVLDQLHLTGR